MDSCRDFAYPVIGAGGVSSHFIATLSDWDSTTKRALAAH